MNEMNRNFESTLNRADNYAVPLRPHHGMCLAYFKGYGYSDDFQKHMGEMLEFLVKNIPVKLGLEVDEICSACPNNQNHHCKDAQCVKRFDKGVLELCGLEEGRELLFLDFVKIVQDKVLAPGRRPQICGNCQWNEICSAENSRWEAF